MSSVTDAELNAAAQKLIEEANAESEAALAEYERDCLSARFRLLERGTYRSSILQDSLNELRAAYDKLVLRIQRELDESLEALYAEAEEPDDGEDPGGDGEDPGGDGEDPDEPEAPYEVDESLSMRDRYIAVKNYYLSIPNAADALEALRDDSVAKEYLGTYYNYLEQLLIMMQ